VPRPQQRTSPPRLRYVRGLLRLRRGKPPVPYIRNGRLGAAGAVEAPPESFEQVAATATFGCVNVNGLVQALGSSGCDDEFQVGKKQVGLWLLFSFFSFFLLPLCFLLKRKE
jgi:hypothetical protein